MSSLARLVLDKAALCGLKVSLWDPAAGRHREGVIEDYAPSTGCYIIVGPTARFAVLFHQFTVEEEGEELVLKVTRASPVPLPPGVSESLDEEGETTPLPSEAQAFGAGAGPAAAAGEPQSPGGASRTSSGGPQPLLEPDSRASPYTSARPSRTGSTGSGGLGPEAIGARFSQTDEGFEAVVVGGGNGNCSGEGVLAAGGETAAGIAAARVVRRTSSTGTTGGTPGGSRLRTSSSSGPPAGGMAVLAPPPAPPRRTSSGGRAASAAAAFGVAAAATVLPGPVPEGRAWEPAAESQSPLTAASSGSIAAAAAQAPDVAAADAGRRESDDAGGTACGSYWGTPAYGGTPRGDLMTAGSGGGGNARPRGAAGGDALGPALLRRMAGFEEISRMILTDAPPPAWLPVGVTQQAPATEQSHQQQQQQQQQQVVQDQLPTAGSGAAEEEQETSGAPQDFLIGTTVAVPEEGPLDVGVPLPPGRGAWRVSHSTIDQELSATDEGMIVETPQPLSARRASRVSARTLGAEGTATFDRSTAAPGVTTATAPGLQRALSGAAAGAAGWRVGRTLSARAHGAAGDQLTAAHAAAGRGDLPTLPGPLYAPAGAISRRASRTLSGRLPPDQEPPPAAEAVFDVAPRPPPVPPPAAAGTVLTPGPAATAAVRWRSRTAAAAEPSGRETPDSDGFGYSGFEEDIPQSIPPPPGVHVDGHHGEPLLGVGPQLRRRHSARGPLAAGPDAGPDDREGGHGQQPAAEPVTVAAAAEAPAPPPRGPGPVGRSVSGLLQAVAAAAAAAEAFIGHRISGGGGGAAAVAEGSDEETPEGSVTAGGAEGPPVFGGGALIGAKRAIELTAPMASSDSFSSPPIFPFGGLPGDGGFSGVPAAQAPGAAARGAGSLRATAAAGAAAAAAAQGPLPLLGVAAPFKANPFDGVGFSKAGLRSSPFSAAAAVTDGPTPWGQTTGGPTGSTATTAAAPPAPPMAAAAAAAAEVVQQLSAAPGSDADDEFSGDGGTRGIPTYLPTAGPAVLPTAGAAGAAAAAASAGGLVQAGDATAVTTEGGSGVPPRAPAELTTAELAPPAPPAPGAQPSRVRWAPWLTESLRSRTPKSSLAGSPAAPQSAAQQSGLSEALRAAWPPSSGAELSGGYGASEGGSYGYSYGRFAAADEAAVPLMSVPLASDAAAYVSTGTEQVVQLPEGFARVLSLAAVATAAQCYDAAAFAFMGAQVAGALLPPNAPAAQRLAGITVLYVAGIALRPIGAALGPSTARALGPRPAALAVAAASGLPAALVGALPTYSQAANVGAVAALVLRLMQGLVLGSDAAAAVALASETGGPNACLFASLVPAAGAAGAAAAAAVAAAVAAAAGPDALARWAWRLPLVASLLVATAHAAVRLAVLRRNPAISAAQPANAPELVVAPAPTRARACGGTIAAAAIVAFPAAAFALLAALLPAQLSLSGAAAVTTRAALEAQVANLVLLAAAIVLGGWLADATGRVSTMLCSAAAAAAIAYPAWTAVVSGVPALAWLAQLLLLTAAGLFCGAAAEGAAMALPPSSSSSSSSGIDLPTSVRRGATLSAAVSFGVAFAGGSAPLAALALASATGDASAPAGVVIAAAGVSAAAAWLSRRPGLF